MLMSNKNVQTHNIESRKNQNGFSLLEAIVALLIISIALMGTAASLSYAFEYGTTSRTVGSARLAIVSTLEEIESLRNTHRLTFLQLANVSDVDNTDAKNPFNGFSENFKAISLNPGFDGVFGTDDDLKEAGPDAILGNADDIENPALARGGYMRKISIAPLPLDPKIKKVVVTIRYFSTGGKVSQVSGIAYINDESRTTG
jgi:prepilin-type N-terminal cleavage/methylation domain-containing protein